MTVGDVTRHCVENTDLALRFELRCSWGPGPELGFVLLNPSTADAYRDDPTVRKLYGFAQQLGYHRIRLVNLLPYRATDPGALPAARKRAAERAAALRSHELASSVQLAGEGLERLNERHLRDCVQSCPMVIVGWGAWGERYPVEVRRFVEIAAVYLPIRAHSRAEKVPLHCFGTTAGGSPRHPVRLPYAAELVPWSGRA